MLRWRLTLGPLVIALLAALCWADAQATRPGIWLVPLALVLCLLATQEIRRLCCARSKEQGSVDSKEPCASSIEPLRWVGYFATLLPVAAACAPIAWLEYPRDCPVGRLGWLACGLAAGLLVALAGEMLRYEKPGKTILSFAIAALSILYVGGLLGFLIQLRLLPVAGNVSQGGLLAMLSMIIVVKLTDIGAYTTGRLFGRHKLAPVLSPGKTWEGAAGGLGFAALGALLALGPLADKLGLASERGWGIWLAGALAYAVLVGTAGILGDLGESLLKRDAGVKDSSTWLPGFGGVLDLLDSLLVAAPVAYFCWISGLLGY